ncbi:MAG TPA: protein-L-isoaspartate O-methyltransferase [Steroidobacteraceae bacterium]|nr:protein-L-isoaspartate O-methyltransferase [Steroidobacteraceae bacterium]
MNTRLEAARRQMIEQQVRTWDVLETRVLDALAAVPREHFVPEAYRGVAFADAAIPIGHGQCMLKPAVEGRMLQALAPKRGERVLEIGTGTGFFAACLAQLAGDVESIEIFDDLAAGAQASFATLGLSRVTVTVADAFAHDFGGGYEVIAVTGSLPLDDLRFERALSVGGRLFIVIGMPPAMEARLITRTAENAWLRETPFETSIEPLLHAAEAPRFRF